MSAFMRVLDTGLMSSRRNIAVTGALTELHRAGLIADTLRFSTYPTSVLLGCDQGLLDVVRVKACRRRYVDVARRITGGDAFYADAGVLIWDLVSERRPFSGSPGNIREHICSGLAAGLRRFGLPVQCGPLGRIELDGRTIAASSASVDGPIVVFQGMVLIDPDLAEAMAVLREPREPQRPHDQPVRMAWPNAVHARAEEPPARRPRAGMAIRVPRRSVECGGATAGGPFTGLRHRCAATRRNIRRHARRKTDCGGERNGSRRTVTKRLLIVLMNT